MNKVDKKLEKQYTYEEAEKVSEVKISIKQRERKIEKRVERVTTEIVREVTSIPELSREFLPEVKLHFVDKIEITKVKEPKIPVISTFSLLKAPKISLLLSDKIEMYTKTIEEEILEIPRFHIEYLHKIELVADENIRLRPIKFELYLIPRLVFALKPRVKISTIDDIYIKYARRDTHVLQLIRENELTSSAIKYEKESELYEFNIFKILTKDSADLVSVEPGGPIYVVVDKTHNFHELIIQLCSLLLRIWLEGLPSTRYSRYTEEYSISRLKEKELLIIKENFIDLLKDDKKRRELESSMIEYHAQQACRFIIIPVESKYFERVVNELKNQRELGRYVHKLLVYKGTWNEKSAKALTAFFGFTHKMEDLVDFKSAPAMLNSMYEKLNNIRRKLETKINAVDWPKGGGELNNEESWMHYTLKWFALHHLTSRKIAKAKEIKYETKIDSIIPDIIIENRKLAIEIETFYGKGDPMISLNDKIQEYVNEGYKLWIVIPNPQALLYSKNLLKFRKDYKENGLDIEIYTLDLTGYGHKLIYEEIRPPGLIKLIDIIKWLRASMKT